MWEFVKTSELCRNSLAFKIAEIFHLPIHLFDLWLADPYQKIISKNNLVINVDFAIWCRPLMSKSHHQHKLLLHHRHHLLLLHRRHLLRCPQLRRLLMHHCPQWFQKRVFISFPFIEKVQHKLNSIQNIFSLLVICVNYIVDMHRLHPTMWSEMPITFKEESLHESLHDMLWPLQVCSTRNIW